MEPLTMKPFARYSAPVLRITLACVFLYFGFSQLSNPHFWIDFVPTVALGFNVSAETLVMLNAFFEMGLGVLLLVGLYVRVTSFLLALHLIGIALSIGFNPLGIRDLGLALATFVVFLNGADHWCLEEWMKKK